LKIDGAKIFAGLDACFLAWDLRQGRLVGRHGTDRCQLRLPACSTFKVPLALMAFDAGFLKDEDTLLEWDKVQRPIESWNRDHTARSWMANSVVWYSQRLTPQLGPERIQRYLDGFGYGNRDFSAGLTSAWLTISKSDSDPGKGSLRISALEQLEFLKRLWRGELPVSPGALAKTKALLLLETSPGGFTLHGKTGSGYPDDLKGDFGWFIGHLEGAGRELVVVTAISRDERATDARFPGLKAKELTKAVLAGAGLW
jgi:beta-lactamase class D